MASPPTFARIRRQLLTKPGFTRLPVCSHCQKEIPLVQYAQHTRECEKAARKTPEKAQAPATATTEIPTPKPGLVYALFDERAARRLERAGYEILRLRQELHEQHDTFKPGERAQRWRELARRECLSMAIVVAQVRHRLGLQGSGAVFIPGIRPHVVSDHLRDACNELVRMTHPAAWGDV